jgi:hypothetical protein
MSGDAARLARALIAFVTAAAAAGCSAGEGGAAFTQRDSAGVTIVENLRAAWSPEQAWRLSDEPALDIGALDGAEEYQLFRTGGALKLDDGRIVVANGGTGELRYYDQSGRYLHSAGRKGSGPGEFEGIGLLSRYPGDSLLVYDFWQSRASVLDLDGGFGRVFTLQAPGDLGRLRPSAVFSDGSVLGSTSLLLSPDLNDQSSRVDVLYMTFSETGEFRDSLARVPGPERYVRTRRGEGGVFGISITALLFARGPVWAVDGTSSYYGGSERYEIGYYSHEGSLQRIVRRPLQPVPVTDADIQMAIEEELQSYPNDESRRSARQAFAEMEIPETMPAFTDFVVDAERNLWVREYRQPGEEGERWTVYDVEGRMLGTLSAPEQFRITDIGPDYVLGIWTDDIDVEHVQLYPLQKPEA